MHPWCIFSRQMPAPKPNFSRTETNRMNTNDLIRLGVPQGDAQKLAYAHMKRLFAGGMDREQVEAELFAISPWREVIGSPSPPRASSISSASSASWAMRLAGLTRLCSSVMPTALIIDDDEQILAMVEERLASMGHDCLKAQSQTEAEELLEQHAFDYILLDLEIPSRFQGRADMIYGQNLLRKLVDTPEHAHTPVIVITAHGVGSYSRAATWGGMPSAARWRCASRKDSTSAGEMPGVWTLPTARASACRLAKRWAWAESKNTLRSERPPTRQYTVKQAFPRLVFS